MGQVTARASDSASANHERVTDVLLYCIVLYCIVLLYRFRDKLDGKYSERV